MNNFFNPTQICNADKMTNEELLDAIRKDIIGEFEAIIQYGQHIRSTDNVLAKKVWTDIRNEEKRHVGELFTLLATLAPEDMQYFTGGEKEVKEMIESMS